MKNIELKNIFEQLADMLEFLGEDEFKVRAYRNAARAIDSLSADIEKIAAENKLQTIPGIGKKIAEKIEEYLKTGKMRKYEEVKEKVPEGILKIMKIPGIGAKTVKRLYDELGIKDINDLKQKIETKEILNVPKIREKTVEKILKGIEFVEKIDKEGKRHLLWDALRLAREVKKYIQEKTGAVLIEEAGSLRRRKSTVKDIDILTAGIDGEKVGDIIGSSPFFGEFIAKGKTKTSFKAKTGDKYSRESIQVDVRVVEEDSYGSALQYFTGSKAHNIKLRKIAQEKGYKLNEYGIFDKKEKKIAGKTEEEVYRVLGLHYIPPELREDWGEIEWALEKEIPPLVEMKDIKGDLHIHSSYSDGHMDIETIAKIAQEKWKYHYVAIADHSLSTYVAGGLKEDELREKNKEIDKLNKKLSGIRVLKSAEVDILENGELDYPDEVLKELDIVIAAVHSKLNLPKEKMTQRIIKALKNKYVDILAHPSGILIYERDAYDVDWDEIFRVAKEEGKAIEINAFYKRLDLADNLVKEAINRGILLAIGTDAHHTDQLEMMELGVSVARRGWCEKKHILNTFTLEELFKWLGERKK